MAKVKSFSGDIKDNKMGKAVMDSYLASEEFSTKMRELKKLIDEQKKKDRANKKKLKQLKFTKTIDMF